MRRHELSDAEWSRIEPLLGTRSGPRSKRGDRDFINAVVWRVRTGVQWRDLPERFGHWKTVYNRFHRWAKTGRWEAIFKALRLDVDELRSLVDASVVRVHQDAAGGKGGRRNALGRSRGGFSTKVHAVTTTDGKPLHLALTAGQQHESTMAEELLVHAEGDAFIADTGYDADRIRANVRKLGMKPVIHSNPSRKRALPLNRTLYRLRYRVEETFRDVKDLKFGMGLKQVRVKTPERRDRLLLISALAQVLLTLLGAAGEALGYDKHLKVNTAKKRTHSLFTQGAYYFMAMPRMSDERLRPLVERFGQLVREHAVFREAFGLI